MKFDKSNDNVVLPIKKKTLNNLIEHSCVLAGADFVITPVIFQIITGEYKPLHEYLGLDTNMTELQVRIGGAYWGATLLYTIIRKNKPSIKNYFNHLWFDIKSYFSEID